MTEWLDATFTTRRMVLFRERRLTGWRYWLARLLRRDVVVGELVAFWVFEGAR